MNKLLKRIHLNHKLITHKKNLPTSLQYFPFSSSSSSTFSPPKKESPWLYSSKHDQLQYRKPGHICLYTHIKSDTHNASLRLCEHLQSAHLILTNQPKFMHSYLTALSNKTRFAEPVQDQERNEKDELGTEIQLKTGSTALSQLKTENSQKTQFESEIQISKMIQFEKEFKEKGQSGQEKSQQFEREAKQIRKYMEVKRRQRMLESLRNKQGFAGVVGVKDIGIIWGIQNQQNRQIQLETEQGKQLLKKYILQLQKDGFNIVFAFTENKNSILMCGQVIKILEQSQLSYQILPCTDQLVTAIVSSGLPADRFSFQIFPTESFQTILARRSKMKITMCFQILTQKLSDLVASIIKILGKQHIIYLHNPNPSTPFFRGQAIQLQSQLPLLTPSSPICYLILSPFIPQFNQSLKSQLNLKSHLIGQLQSPKINLVQMQILVQKLNSLQKKQKIHQVDTHKMTAQLLTKFKGNQDIVKKILRKILPYKGERDIQVIIGKGKQGVVVDWIGVKGK